MVEIKSKEVSRNMNITSIIQNYSGQSLCCSFFLMKIISSITEGDIFFSFIVLIGEINTFCVQYRYPGKHMGLTGR